MTNIKMNTLLAKVDQTASIMQAMIREQAAMFKTNQTLFRGEKNTYEARDGYLDKPEKRGVAKVVATVQEKLDAFKERFVPYLEELFRIEATNSKGASRVELKVGNYSFGWLTAAELMRLRNILTSKELDTMYANIPVRSSARIYEQCTDEEYEGRDVVQTPIARSVERTTEVEDVILRDPNIDPEHLPANYRSTVVQKRRLMEIGDSTHQEFSGEWTLRKKDELLRRKSDLLTAITVALKQVNEVEAEQSNLNAQALLDFLQG